MSAQRRNKYRTIQRQVTALACKASYLASDCKGSHGLVADFDEMETQFWQDYLAVAGPRLYLHATTTPAPRKTGTTAKPYLATAETGEAGAS